MKLENLLEDNNRYKILMLRYLEIEKNNYLTMTKYYEFMGLSRYKFNLYFEELKKDLFQFNSNPRILVNDRDEIILKNINYALVKQLNGVYFQESITVKFLTSIVIDGLSVDQFAKKEHLSISVMYEKRKVLNDFFIQNKLSLRRNKIQGDELKIRNTLFSLYFEFLGGMTLPFSEDNKGIINDLIVFLEYNYNLKLTKTRLKKLELFVAISLFRMRQKNYIKENIIQDEAFKYDTAFITFYDKMRDLLPAEMSCEQLTIEVSYLVLYLTLEGEIEDSFLEYYQTTIFKKMDFLTGKVVSEIFNTMPFIEDIEPHIIEEIRNKFYKNIKLCNRKYAIFDFQLATFTSANQVNYFLETYPNMSRIIKQSIQDEMKNYFSEDNLILTRLFYDYIFILLACCPIKYFQKTIYVCVDFSQGIYYTDYIVQEIEGFKNFNIQIEKRLSSKTDIYISDCLVEKNNFHHILWKNPPAADDWEDFGNAVAEINLNRGRQKFTQ